MWNSTEVGKGVEMITAYRLVVLNSDGISVSCLKTEQHTTTTAEG